MKKIALVLVSLMFSSVALAAAGPQSTLSLFKYDYAVDGDSIGNGESTHTQYDFKLGYDFGNNIYAGFIYNSRTVDTGGADSKRTAYGGTVGYHGQAWFIDFSYFLSAEYEDYKKGSGMGLDLGYNHMLNSNVFLGVQWTYKTFTYTEVGGASEDNKEKSEMHPMLNIGVKF